MNHMDLSTTYMGLKLKNPVIASSQPLTMDLDNVKKLEDAGASAVVLYSLFEEQINQEAKELDHFLSTYSESYAEAMSYFPEPKAYRNLHAEEYLDYIAKLKKSVNIPVIASLNGVSSGGWMNYSKKMQEAGADAIELNIYYIAADPYTKPQDVEQMYIDDLKMVKSQVSIPVSMKLSPYFSSFANMAVKLDQAGADGLVLFNRFYQPDINLHTLQVEPSLQLSTSYDIRLSLRWIAILYGNVNCGIAATSGVHSYQDALKMIMSGADAVMIASALLKSGIGKISEIISGMETWMKEHEYESVSKMKGSVSYRTIAEPAAFERANYIKTLQSYK